MSVAPDWWTRIDRWKKVVGYVVAGCGLIGSLVLWGERLARAVDLPEPFDALKDTTHGHFSWAEQKHENDSETHQEFLELADSIAHMMHEFQTQQMIMRAEQKWMICDEKMEDDIAAGLPPRDCPPQIILPGRRP